jgi:hypothetical protein
MKTPSQVFGKPCRKCNTILDASNMYPFYIGLLCKSCKQKDQVAASEKYRKIDRDRFLARTRKAGKKHYEKSRMEVIAGYGGKCSCCGESETKFLTVDHVNNDGHKERGHRHKLNPNSYGLGLYRRIIKEGFPSRYQVLCMNCNFGKRMNNGVCPHQESGVTTIPDGSTAKQPEARCLQ